GAEGEDGGLAGIDDRCAGVDAEHADVGEKPGLVLPSPVDVFAAHVRSPQRREFQHETDEVAALRVRALVLPTWTRITLAATCRERLARQTCRGTSRADRARR